MKKSVALPPNVELLFGTRDENLGVLQKKLNVVLTLHEDAIVIAGATKGVRRAQQILTEFKQLAEAEPKMQQGDVNALLQAVANNPEASLLKLAASGKKRAPGSKRQIQPKNPNQARYMEAIDQNDMVFGIGPAGTGKTYLATAMAVSYLLQKKVERLVLVRPAVEAGERLGFLPGTLQDKVDPYLRPLYDALYDMVQGERVEKMLESQVIEVAPLAFMRGRTLSNAFVIMDEAQNTTSEQMKMFLTRLGFNSKAVITGDITQIDLPKHQQSGLVEAIRILKGVEGICFHEFGEADVVRHPLVQRIVRAYEEKK